MSAFTPKRAPVRAQLILDQQCVAIGLGGVTEKPMGTGAPTHSDDGLMGYSVNPATNLLLLPLIDLASNTGEAKEKEVERRIRKALDDGIRGLSEEDANARAQQSLQRVKDLLKNLSQNPGATVPVAPADHTKKGVDYRIPLDAYFNETLPHLYAAVKWHEQHETPEQAARSIGHILGRGLSRIEGDRCMEEMKTSEAFQNELGALMSEELKYYFPYLRDAQALVEPKDGAARVNIEMLSEELKAHLIAMRDDFPATMQCIRDNARKRMRVLNEQGKLYNDVSTWLVMDDEEHGAHHDNRSDILSKVALASPDLTITLGTADTGASFNPGIMRVPYAGEYSHDDKTVEFTLDITGDKAPNRLNRQLPNFLQAYAPQQRNGYATMMEGLDAKNEELAHAGLDVLFENRCLPYRKTDKVAMERYAEALQEIMQDTGMAELLGLHGYHGYNEAVKMAAEGKINSSTLEKVDTIASEAAAKFIPMMLHEPTRTGYPKMSAYVDEIIMPAAQAYLEKARQESTVTVGGDATGHSSAKGMGRRPV